MCDIVLKIDLLLPNEFLDLKRYDYEKSDCMVKI